MTARLFLASRVAIAAISLGATLGACELVVGDGNYKVAASSGAASSGNSTSGSTAQSGTAVSSGSTAAGTGGSGAASGSALSGSLSSSGTTSSGPNAECIACEQTTCQDQWNACQSNATCVSFRNCEATCGTQPCNCEAMFPAGAAQWLALNTCATSNCAPCPYMGAGDPCMEDVDCTGFFTCSEWCTQECAMASDCAGLNYQGKNLFGQTVYCVPNAGNVNSCFPGCTSNADCQAFPGTDCEMAMPVGSATSVSICTLPADAN